MSRIHDVVIVGAGPGGSAAAHFLAREGMDVLLLDKSNFPRDKTCGDCLTPRALGVLKDMGLLDKLAKAGKKINGLEVHGAKGNTMVSSIPDQGDYPNYLMIVKRYRLDELIRQRAVEKGAKFQSPVKVRGIEHENGQVNILAESQGKSLNIKARMAILAIGANLGMPLKMGVFKKKPTLIMAARGYYENMTGLTDHIQAHFDAVPLPGYGWVFPLSDTAANVGVGYWKPFFPWQKSPSSARSAMVNFLQGSKMKPMMADAQLMEQIKGYPLRIDFATAPTYTDHTLFVGETAGLVSPLTGEGIDFALESGMLAAEFLADAFNTGDFSPTSLAGYDKLLREKFQRLFVFLNYIRRLYINPILMDRAVKATHKNADLRRSFVKILMSETDAAKIINFTAFRQIIFGG